MLANPSETMLDRHGYPLIEEIKTSANSNISEANQQQLFSNAPN